MAEKTFGMIKPEGIQYRTEIKRRILAAGLEIELETELVLTETQFEELYGHVKNNVPRVYQDFKLYMTSNPVVMFRINGEKAKEKLLELRGASNASEAKPGTIRGDYAHDQDYKTLYAQGQFAKNVFHAADVCDAERMVNLFFKGK